MIHFSELKGFTMITIIVIGLIALAYFVVMRSTQNVYKPNENNHIPQRIKDEINDHFGNLIVMNANLDAIGFVYDDFNHEGDQVHSPHYLLVLKVKLERQDKCISVLLEDLSEVSVMMAISDLIKKIKTTQDDLRISC